MLILYMLLHPHFFQTCLTFLPKYSLMKSLMNVHAALFNTLHINGKQTPIKKGPSKFNKQNTP